jgi:hypothetical protein
MTTIAIQIKEKMAIMPDTFDTKKGVETYFKDAMKNIVTTAVDKPKRKLSAYQQYVSLNIKLMKEQNPQLLGTEVLSLVAKMWRESQNGDNAKPVNEEKKEDEKVSDTEIEEEKQPDVKPPDVKPPDVKPPDVKPPDVKAMKKKK